MPVLLEMLGLLHLGNTLYHTLEKKKLQLRTLQLLWVVEAMGEMAEMAARVELGVMVVTEGGAAMEV